MRPSSCWIAASSSSCGHARELPGVELALGARRTSASGPAASRSASASVGAVSSASGTTRLIRPHSSAFGAGTRSPSSAISAARANPIRSGIRKLEPPSGAEADVHEREQEVRGLGREDQVAGEREAEPDAHRRAVDRGDHRLGHRPEALDDRVVALVQRRCRGPASRPRRADAPPLRSAPEQNARPGAGQDDRADASRRRPPPRPPRSSSVRRARCSTAFIASGRSSDDRGHARRGAALGRSWVRSYVCSTCEAG